jgi:hypothetical protein
MKSTPSNRFRQPMQLGMPLQQIRFSYWPARIHSLEESIPGLLKVRLWRGFSIFVCFYHLSDVGSRLSSVDFGSCLVTVFECRLTDADWRL